MVAAGIARRDGAIEAEAGGRERFVPVLGIHVDRQSHLLLVAEAGGLPRLLPGLGKYREEDGCQDGNDGNYHQQLD